MSLDAGRVGVRADQVDVHGRVTSPSFLNELLEDLPEWTDMSVWVNGTEELLPSNNSVPVTSPILADIAYPDIRRDNQYFTYRESPTPVDGLAKIKSIKGNTLKWNQLVENGNFASTSRWSVNNITTYSVANNILTFSFSANDGFIGHAGIPLVKNHKYIWLMDFKTDLPSPYRENIKLQNYKNGGWSIANRVRNNDWNTYSTIFTFTEDSATVTAPFFRLVSYTDGAIDISNSNQIRNVQVFDLTQMGLDSITEPSEFTSLFSLPFYDYNQGTLLSFMGNGIKTVGKNLVFKTIPSSTISGGGTIISTSSFQMSVAPVLKGKEYVITTNDNSKKVLGFFYEEPVVGSVSYNAERIDDSSSYTFTSPITGYVAFRCLNGYSTPMLEFGSTSTDYEPYTSSTLSLPISTYFPTGMKSAGSVYDELTPTKAITRIGAVDMGTLNWSYVAADRRFIAIVSDAKSSSGLTVLENIVSAKYENATWENILTQAKDKIIALHYTSNNSYVAVIDNDYTDAVAFKSAMSGIYLYYELATPVELPTLSLGE